MIKEITYPTNINKLKTQVAELTAEISNLKDRVEETEKEIVKINDRGETP